jgi:CRISPR-associated protein Cmr2
MTRHLFLITIGPVQEFIAGARRTRDLWFGSWLLSELSRTAAGAIKTNGGEVQLIFPPDALIDDDRSDLANVANKILATVEADPKQLGVDVPSAVKKRLMQLWDAAIDPTKDPIKGPIEAPVARRQIEDLLEIYWASVELPTETDYANARRQVEALMAARKTTRDFAQVTWGDKVPKSSIDGQRESVINEAQFPRPGMPDDERQSIVDALYKNYRAGPAERLSGVDLLKRHGNPSQGSLYFPSTSDISVRPLLRRLRANESVAETAWKQFLTVIEQLAAGRLREERVSRNHPILGHYDGGLLLESRLYELIDDRRQQREARNALTDFYRAVDAPRPAPYYAIVLADGDRMGATIDYQTTLDRHVELSRRLGDFAANARRIVEEHEGALIYAGGDDVLAFVPLHTLLACVRSLHESFALTINPKNTERFADKDGNEPTLSVGVAMCHQIEPLSDALNLARTAEKAAKAIDGKNALAITLSKRSGADVTVSGRWGRIDRDLSAFATMHRMEALPDGTAFQWRDLAERLTPKRGEPTIPPAAVLAEARRILGRKEPERGTKSLAAATRNQLHNALDAAIGQSDTPTVALAGLRSVADEVIVARILADAADHAGLPLEEKL